MRSDVDDDDHGLIRVVRRMMMGITWSRRTQVVSREATQEPTGISRGKLLRTRLPPEAMGGLTKRSLLFLSSDWALTKREEFPCQKTRTFLLLLETIPQGNATSHASNLIIILGVKDLHARR